MFSIIIYPIIVHLIIVHPIIVHPNLRMVSKQSDLQEIFFESSTLTNRSIFLHKIEKIFILHKLGGLVTICAEPAD